MLQFHWSSYKSKSAKPQPHYANEQEGKLPRAITPKPLIVQRGKFTATEVLKPSDHFEIQLDSIPNKDPQDPTTVSVAAERIGLHRSTSVNTGGPVS